MEGALAPEVVSVGPLRLLGHRYPRLQSRIRSSKAKKTPSYLPPKNLLVHCVFVVHSFFLGGVGRLFEPSCILPKSYSVS